MLAKGQNPTLAYEKTWPPGCLYKPIRPNKSDMLTRDNYNPVPLLYEWFLRALLVIMVFSDDGLLGPLLTVTMTF